MNNGKLDKRDLALLNFIGEYTRIHGFSPTFRQCARLLYGRDSTEAIRLRIFRLSKLGYISRKPNHDRTLRRTSKEYPALDT